MMANVFSPITFIFNACKSSTHVCFTGLFVFYLILAIMIHYFKLMNSAVMIKGKDGEDTHTSAKRRLGEITITKKNMIVD